MYSLLDPSRRVALTLHIDGESVASVNCQTYRSDVASAGHPASEGRVPVRRFPSPRQVIRAKGQCMAGLGGADPVERGMPGSMANAIGITSGAGGR